MVVGHICGNHWFYNFHSLRYQTFREIEEQQSANLFFAISNIMKKTLSFLALWLCWGFTLGTITLLGPLRWVVDYGRTQSWAETSEKSTVYIFIALLVIVSAVFALLSLKRIYNHNTSRAFKAVLFTIPVIGIAMSVLAFMNPAIVNKSDSSKEEKIGSQFGVGPYPELVKMYQLKADGYTGVISLLHPAVVPFEPALLEREKKEAQEAGLAFINIPLLPWISDNKEAIDSLRRLIRTAKGKYYVHCYLGKDRTNAAGRIIKQENSVMVDMGLKKKESGLLDDTLKEALLPSWRKTYTLPRYQLKKNTLM